MSNIFLNGSTIDLTIPEESDLDIWHSWFNDHNITEFLYQGRFPNTKEKQINFWESSESKGKLLLMIKTKDHELLGVINLSFINQIRRSCDIAYVCPVKNKKSPFAIIEAIALMSEHAFERMGLEKIYATHAWPGLDNWFLKTEVLGFRLEGFHFNGFRNGQVYSHSIRTSLTFTRFIKLKKLRSGNFYPGDKIFSKNYLRHKQEKSSAFQIKEILEDIHNNQDINLSCKN
tara:strand:- start:1747 stop:2439 length:693 start_codon:yes stop_codon:yes gene_type:complete